MYEDIDAYGYGLSYAKSQDLARLCAWMRLLDNQLHIELFGSSVQSYFTGIAHIIQTENLHSYHVTNGRTLQRKLRRFKRLDREGMLSQKYGSTNAQKITEIGLKYIINLYANPLKPTLKAITTIYNETASSKGWKKLCSKAIATSYNVPKTNLKSIPSGTA